MKISLVRGFVAVTAACAVVTTAVSAAWADLKVVSEITVKGAPSMGVGSGGSGTTSRDTEKPLVTTAYYKGDFARMDYDETSVVTDYKANTTTTYNLKNKTFFVTKDADAKSGAANSPEMAMLSSLKAEVKGDVKPGNGSLEVAGKTTKNYLYNATIKLSAPADAAFPVPSEMLPTLVFKGENWTSEAVSVPAHYTTSLAGLPGAGMLKMFGDSMKDFTTKLQAVPGFPLKTTLTIETILSPSALAFIGDGQAPQPVIVTSVVKNISEDPLDDKLFGPRDGFTETKAPARPQNPFGGPAGGAGGTQPPAKP